MSAVAAARNRYTCPCSRELQVFGRGRHRLYFALGDPGFADPVMDGTCPDCRQALPGKHVSAPA